MEFKNLLQFCESFCSMVSGTNVPIPLRKEIKTMSAVDQLISYIMKLTPEQAEKVLRHLPRLVSLLDEPSNTKEEYISAITKALCNTNDIVLLDLILQLLQKSRNA